MARSHFKYIVRDAYGYAIQNATVDIFQPGTTTVFTGTAYTTQGGGTTTTNPFLTNNQGEIEAWFDTPQHVDVRVGDTSDTAYRAVEGASSTLNFTTFTESATIESSPTDVQAHGASYHTNLTRQLWLPVNDGAVIDGGTLSSLGTAPDIIRTISMADAATSGASWGLTVPGDWASGALTAEIFFVGASTTSGSVRWSVVSREVAEGADITTAGTTVTQTSQAPTTANLLVVEPSITLITPNAAGRLVKLNVRRLGTDGADNYAATIHLLGVLLSYTATQ